MRPAILALTSVALLSTALLGREYAPLSAQTERPAALVIDGGTLIDGNGGPPVADAQVVIEGNRIARVGRKGAPTPDGAQVIRADGKFIVPGLWDSQMVYYWYHAEPFLTNGVTSYVGIGDMGEVSIAYRRAVAAGRIRAPRGWDAPVHFQGEANNLTGLESPFDSPHPLTTPQEARDMVKRVVALGADVIFFQNGNLPVDVFRAAVEEADRAGKPVAIRAGGPLIFPREAAEAGADFLPRSAGNGLPVSIATGMPAAEGPVNELDAWSYMDDAKAKELIQLLVQRNVALVPNFFQKGPGLPRGWSRFEAQDRRMFADPSLMAYYPAARAQVILWNYVGVPNAPPDVRERRMKGWQNALRFHRMYVQAGGRVLAGTDGGQFASPGLGLHHELEIFAEDMGLTPMQVLQSATRWPAEAIRVPDRAGTIGTGKLADLLIVDEDPLASIANLQKIAYVIADGRVHERGYHAWYRSPFTGEGPVTLPVVEDVQKVVAMKRARVGFGNAGLAAPLPQGPGPARQPQPMIEAIAAHRKDYDDEYLAKVMVKEGGPTLDVTITGFNFFARSVAVFNGIKVPTRVVSRTEVVATIDESLTRSAGRYPIVVQNIGPADPANPEWGDGTSNTAWLLVDYP